MYLICYKAMCGDAFHLRFVGDSGKPRNVFLDMGHSRTYSSVLKDVVYNLIGNSEHIDALFLSHIHDDHIGGASKFIKDIQKDDNLNKGVTRWVYNAPKRYAVDKVNVNGNGVLCGIASGDKVYEHILAVNPYDLNDVVAGQTMDIDGMKVTVISPNTKGLNKLRDKYSNNRPLCKSETNEVSVEAGYVRDDYAVPLKEFNPENFHEDTNIENASSIAAIFEFEGKRLIWLSDSVPTVIIKSLVKLGFSETNKMQCDAVLLSHHGSSANNSFSLFKMISAGKYIISADGYNRHCLPNKETVARLVAASAVLPVSVYFNYNDGRLLRMFESDEPMYLQSVIDIYYLEDCEAIAI